NSKGTAARSARGAVERVGMAWFPREMAHSTASIARPAGSRTTSPRNYGHTPKPRSYIEEEVHHVAVVHHVFLAFDAQEALGARRGLRPLREKLVPPDHLGPDESALEIRVDDARGLRRPGSLADDPGAAFVLAGGEVALQSEEVEARPDQLGKARLGEADRGEELLAVVLVQLLDLRLHLAADGDGASTLGFGEGLDPGDKGIRVEPRELGLVDVGDVEDGLGGEEEQLLRAGFFLLRQPHAARRPARVEGRLELVVDGEVGLGLFPHLAGRLRVLSPA